MLEVGDATYTRRFGGDRVTHIDVLHVDPEAPGATIVADLADADHIPSDAFDCIVLTQTLHLIYDVAGGGRDAPPHPRPRRGDPRDGPGHLSGRAWSMAGHLVLELHGARRATPIRGARSPRTEVLVEANGNALAAVAFLEGLASARTAP